jgi:TolB protein
MRTAPRLPFALDRRQFLAGALGAVALTPLMGTRAARAVNLTITPGQPFQPIPIAVPFFGGDQALGQQVSQLVAQDLRASGYFAPLDPNTFLDKVVGADVQPRFANWQPTGAQGLVAASIINSGGSIIGQVRVWDVASQQALVGQQFSTSPDNIRRLAHILADQAYSALTGFKGFFDSRIVYVEESGPKNARVKKLAMADWDGANTRYLTRGDDLVLTPRFNANGSQIAYMAYGQGEPKVFILNVANGARSLLGDFPNMTYAPRFSPDGGRILFSLQREGDASLYSMDLRSRQSMALTSGAAIDTSPSFSPDGSRIVFESDRSGVQQIYMMGASGGGADRISFGSGRYATPVWSPDTDNPLIAFTKQEGGEFKIGVMKPDGSSERIIAQGGHLEGPTWSPNGRYVMYFKEGGATGGPQLGMADVTGVVQTPIRTPGFASDPSWSALLR